MSKLNISSKLGSLRLKAGTFAQNAIHSAKIHSPEICLIAGGVSIVGGFILGCIATTKLDEVNEEVQADISEAREMDATGIEKGKLLTSALIRSGWKYAKLYGPGVLATGGGMVLMGNSAMQYKGRYLDMSAAYAGVLTQFMTYRSRHIERYGEESDREIRYGISHDTIKEKVTGEDGKTKTVKKDISVIDPASISPDDFIIAISPTRPDGSPDPLWHDDRMYMVNRIIRTQDEINSVLKLRCWNARKRGVMFYNEVLNLLERTLTQQGQVLGYPSDQVVDFGLQEFDGYEAVLKKHVQDFIDSKTDTLILELTPPIPVLGSLPEKKEV